MIKTWRKLLLTIGTLVFGLFLFQSWYMVHYSMSAAQSYEVNTPGLERRLLIATQGSRFKDAVVKAVVARLQQRPVYIKVIDVSRLTDVDEAKWSAMVLIHTWENWMPQLDAKRFMHRVKAPEKVVVLSTSGTGDEKMEGVDAIAAPSAMEKAPVYARQVLARLEPMLR